MISPFWEGFLLFLIEIGFMIIIGLLYTIPVIIAVTISDWVNKKIEEYRNKQRKG